MFARHLGIAGLALGTLLSLASQPAAFGQDANRAEVYGRTDLGDVVQRVARRSATFREEFNRAVEHSLLDGTKLEDRAKHRADDLHAAANRLKDVYGDKRDKNNPALRDQVDKTLAAASDLNSVVTASRFTEKVQREWDLLKGDLNALAMVYDLPPL
jgi:hypothetical protein